MAIDYGDVRIGIALSDPQGILASPLKTISANSAVSEIAGLVIENEVSVIYLGLPLHLSGLESPSSSKAKDFGLRLKAALNGDSQLRFIDERLSTKSAALRSSMTGKKVSKEDIDQLAAVEILEFALQIEEKTKGLGGHEI